ncbi:MAG: amino acid--tRNA ligase-related protein, partial [Oleiphilaceae bacterium]|nr:amino acid--tRNA ligase-related protein [Oleiphilaceae bacterium]
MSEKNTDQSAPDENRLIAERRDKLHALREGSHNPFPNDFRRDSYAADLQAAYGERSKEDLAGAGVRVAVAGRLMLDRKMFKEIQDMSGRIQVYADKSVQKATKGWDIGDLIGVAGTLYKSGKGDLYVMMEEYVLLTKSLRPLPEKHKGLTDTETRYRQRYVDLIMNEDARQVFRIRSQVINGIRGFFASRDFMEVETPMLQAIPGGAAA